ncbi:hypothetical protein CYLTODRAFT_415809 [Cylindrobasidium torrendii FP15055 ss-10]|uniref:Uncharacterized protein n=1 Tax=Cylindrobasidium torrendii FP15055 ss-10 TaxID=1314674 RepID=A0A0D7ASC1_9AGAR|nr:hypothetical protein CYLTODRAFT_415809 [Cylindrobasidium torrendii FP15055 ss-10]
MMMVKSKRGTPVRSPEPEPNLWPSGVHKISIAEGSATTRYEVPLHLADLCTGFDSHHFLCPSLQLPASAVCDEILRRVPPQPSGLTDGYTPLDFFPVLHPSLNPSSAKERYADFFRRRARIGRGAHVHSVRTAPLLLRLYRQDATSAGDPFPPLPFLIPSSLETQSSILRRVERERSWKGRRRSLSSLFVVVSAHSHPRLLLPLPPQAGARQCAVGSEAVSSKLDETNSHSCTTYSPDRILRDGVQEVRERKSTAPEEADREQAQKCPWRARCWKCARIANSLKVLAVKTEFRLAVVSRKALRTREKHNEGISTTLVGVGFVGVRSPCRVRRRWMRLQEETRRQRHLDDIENRAGRFLLREQGVLVGPRRYQSFNGAQDATRGRALRAGTDLDESAKKCS